MAVIAEKATTCTTDAAAITDRVNGDNEVLVYNHGAIVVYVGSSAVTSSTGMPINPGIYVRVPVPANSLLYGITASSTCAVRVLHA